MLIYGWGQNIAWKELIIDGKSRMLLIRYKYFSIMFIFMAVHSKSYFLQKENENLDLNNPNFFADGFIEQISPERLRAFNNGKLVSVGWWKNWSLLLVILVIIVSIVVSSFTKSNKPTTDIGNNKNITVMDEKLINTTQKLVGVKGVEFVNEVWGLEEIYDYLQNNGKGTYGTEEVAFIYTKTNQTIFDQFINNIAKNKTEIQLEKSLKFQKAAREMGVFMKNFPTAFASYEVNQESVKIYFFSDTQKLDKITFLQFKLAIERTKELGTKKENVYTIPSLGQTFVLTLDPIDPTKIVSFKMADKNEKRQDGLLL